MERFTGQDASFLYMETPSVHMHTLKVAVIDLLRARDLERLSITTRQP